jgi:hypothetical protein
MLNVNVSASEMVMKVSSRKRLKQNNNGDFPVSLVVIGLHQGL